MRCLVLAVLVAGALIAAAPASGRPAIACTAGYKSAKIDGDAVCLRKTERCARRAVLRHRRLRHLCIRMQPMRPGGPKPAAVQSIARR
jgi:hypothetical protein